MRVGHMLVHLLLRRAMPLPLDRYATSSRHRCFSVLFDGKYVMQAAHLRSDLVGSCADNEAIELKFDLKASLPTLFHCLLFVSGFGKRDDPALFCVLTHLDPTDGWPPIRPVHYIHFFYDPATAVFPLFHGVATHSGNLRASQSVARSVQVPISELGGTQVPQPCPTVL